MDTNKMVQQGAYGRLPANAPLNIEYIKLPNKKVSELRIGATRSRFY